MKRQNPLQKALRRIETEGKKHSICLYSATAMALWQHWGKKQEAINRLFDLSHEVWQECAKDHDHSMIQMRETETGIEIAKDRHNGHMDVFIPLWYEKETKRLKNAPAEMVQYGWDKSDGFAAIDDDDIHFT